MSLNGVLPWPVKRKEDKVLAESDNDGTVRTSTPPGRYCPSQASASLDFADRQDLERDEVADAKAKSESLTAERKHYQQQEAQAQAEQGSRPRRHGGHLRPLLQGFITAVPRLNCEEELQQIRQLCH
ncbi:hypothetical protein RvY_18330 [Ramazzottius varieornatus]|uniref:Uncharacterized protein n=1 Tax=Ramazzottius varieornatus TaxID=947166 RepID=A0A1D1W5F1_RAMVA|nr:hypothetical protein RvY_18330 [Ramazzottius varieornatus]